MSRPHFLSFPEIQSSNASLSPALVRLEDHSWQAFINRLFGEHEPEADTDLFPIRENQLKKRWTAGGTWTSKLDNMYYYKT